MNKKILIIYNPIASSGRSESFSLILKEKLEQLGFIVFREFSRRSESEYAEIKNKIEEVDLVLILGGDGTVRNLLRMLADLKKTFSMVPLGNESLFAIQYGLSAELESIIKVCLKPKILSQSFVEIKYNNQDSQAFFTMASMGLDSLTVKSIGLRKGPVNNFIYFKHGIKAALQMRHPLVSIWVDDQLVVDQKRGYWIIANTPQYAKGIALVPQADPNSDLIDIGFIENSGIVEEIKKGLGMLLHKKVRLKFNYFRAENVRIELHDQDYPLQVDGDYFMDQDIQTNGILEAETYKQKLLIAC